MTNLTKSLTIDCNSITNINERNVVYGAMVNSFIDLVVEHGLVTKVAIVVLPVDFNDNNWSNQYKLKISYADINDINEFLLGKEIMNYLNEYKTTDLFQNHPIKLSKAIINLLEDKPMAGYIAVDYFIAYFNEHNYHIVKNLNKYPNADTWCYENITNNFYSLWNMYFAFENKNDAIQFKLLCGSK